MSKDTDRIPYDENDERIPAKDFPEALRHLKIAGDGLLDLCTLLRDVHGTSNPSPEQLQSINDLIDTVCHSTTNWAIENIDTLQEACIMRAVVEDNN